ncbi:indole-3-glycerol-phosphate synthase [Candidatus Micrarchaeota archaeon]|nr:indole-3-glycerol-phosphate synthase [Candidatus Micrarchaeota archaeon]
MSFLEEIIGKTRESISDGYYELPPAGKEKKSLKKQLEKFTIIAEIKPASPTEKDLFSGNSEQLAAEYASKGAGAISVLCANSVFRGRLENLEAAGKTGLPVLAKDFVLSPKQLEAYSGRADAVLLISGIFDRNLADNLLDEMIAHSHSLGLEVVLETRTKEEYAKAMETDADIVGINNRNLDTLELNVSHYKSVIHESKLTRFDATRPDTELPIWTSAGEKKKPAIAESGFSKKEQVEEAKALGLDGVLVGTALLKGELKLEDIT